MERIAFIDLGSNSVRFVITEISNTGSYRLIYQEKDSIRLSENMWEHNALTVPAMDRAIRSMQAFAHMAQVMECTSTYAVATAAVRQASNGTAFCERVLQETGFTLHVISGEEEARLGFLGVINTIGADHFVIFDLGGASTEITLVRNRHIVASKSLPMGALTLRGRFQKGANLLEEERIAMGHMIQEALADLTWAKGCGLPLVGVGGTARNIAKMDQRRLHYAVTKLHNYSVSKQHFDDIVQLVNRTEPKNRKKIPGLSSERADIIQAGLALVEELFHFVGSQEMLVSGSGLREGLFYDYYGKHYLGNRPIIDDILVHSAENILLDLDRYELIHCKYVAKLALILFDQWEELHYASSRVRQLLQVAGLLHDLGKRINYYSHARHGAYMLLNSNVYGLSHVESAFAAWLVMNSHGFTPKEYKNFIYGQLLSPEQKELGLKISLVLALAEALDESHEQYVTSVSTKIKERSVVVTVWVKNNPDVSVSQNAIEKLKKAFKKEYKKSLHIEWEQAL